MKIKVAGLQQHLSWQEQLASNEADALTEEYGWLDDLLEALESGEGGLGAAPRRLLTPMPNFRRYDEAPKVAAQSRLDEEFDSMRTHVRSVMANIGNGR